MMGKAGPTLDGLLVLGVTSASLGVRLGSGGVACVMPRNTTVPKKTEVRPNELLCRKDHSGTLIQAEIRRKHTRVLGWSATWSSIPLG